MGWDRYDGYLFDIDGTLVHCRDAVHYFAFLEALKQMGGRPLTLEGVVTHGNTDPGILRDALALAGVPESQWRPHLRESLAAMCAHVERCRAELCVEVLPGVEAVLDRLRLEGALLAVATGNLEGIGRIKLAQAGLLERFDCGCYSDRFESRREIFAEGASMVRSRLGTSAQICAVGDTPADVSAARANGLDVVAVATGLYSLDELARQRPTLAVRTLDEWPGAEASVGRF